MLSGRLRWLVAAASLLSAPASQAQVPQPFPRPSDPKQQPVTRPSPQPPPSDARPQPTTAVPAPGRQGEEPPNEELLGVPIYPGARFLRSFDAGMGQRYYLFGSTVPFVDLVAYYRNVLRTRGDLVFDEPAVHMFEVGRFREESMAFPPGVTIKDYASGASGGWLDPSPGADPPRFSTIIQVVPVPPADRRR